MKAVIRKASDWKYGEIKEFNTLEELLDFQEKAENPIIISRENVFLTGDIPYDIMIYDDYIE